jgi:DNA segregation ATPase FtsK/SpoIIIE-like protein
MDRRYKYLEENNHKKINTKRDKFNRIVIAVDECTDLLGKVPRDHTDYSYIVKAIEYMDKLARKARAAGIHILLATQKIDKSSIPTRIQEMMGGRLALRVKTMENSIRLIGNRMAYDLPAVPGRAIWSVDSDFKEVQIPFISDDEINLRVKKIKVELENGTKKNFNNKLRAIKDEKKTKADKEAFILKAEQSKVELNIED